MKRYPKSSYVIFNDAAMTFHLGHPVCEVEHDIQSRPWHGFANEIFGGDAQAAVNYVSFFLYARRCHLSILVHRPVNLDEQSGIKTASTTNVLPCYAHVHTYKVKLREFRQNYNGNMIQSCSYKQCKHRETKDYKPI